MNADPVEALKEHGRGHAGGRSLAATLLVAAQLALSLVLVVAAGLFLRTSTELARRNVGTTRDRVLIAAMNAPMTRYTPGRLVGIHERVLDTCARGSGVEQAAISDITPAEGSARVDGDLSFNVISPGWLQTYGVRLLAGRDLLPTDRVNTPPVALVNQAYARRFLGGANPVGQLSERAIPGIGISEPMKVHIVGLVEDAVYRSLRESSVPTMYTSTLQRAEARQFASVSVLASGDPSQISRSVEAAIRRVDPELVWQIRPLNDQISEAMAQERLVALLSGFFGTLALLLSASGTLRRHRVRGEPPPPRDCAAHGAGAGRARVVRVVMRRVAVLAAIGIACGAVLSMWAVQYSRHARLGPGAARSGDIPHRRRHSLGGHCPRRRPARLARHRAPIRRASLKEGFVGIRRNAARFAAEREIRIVDERLVHGRLHGIAIRFSPHQFLQLSRRPHAPLEYAPMKLTAHRYRSGSYRGWAGAHCAARAAPKVANPVVIQFVVDGIDYNTVRTAVATGASTLGTLLKEGVTADTYYCTSPAPRLHLPDGSSPWGGSTSSNVAMHTGTHLFESNRPHLPQRAACRHHVGVRGRLAQHAIFKNADSLYYGANELTDEIVVDHGLRHLTKDNARGCSACTCSTSATRGAARATRRIRSRSTFSTSSKPSILSWRG